MFVCTAMFVYAFSRLSDRGILSGSSDGIMDTAAMTVPIKQLEKEKSELQHKLTGMLSTYLYYNGSNTNCLW